MPPPPVRNKGFRHDSTRCRTDLSPATAHPPRPGDRRARRNPARSRRATPCCGPPCWRTHPYGDITSQTLIPADARATAVLAARVPGVLSGGEVFAAAMKLTDPDADVELLVADGAAFAAGTALARVTGNARAVLLAERVALNLVQRMSAIATKTAEFVALVDGTGARITDTRKTTPGLRVLERYAVRCGGGANHRFGLSDAVLAKDNHLAVLTGGDPSKLTAVLREAKARLGHTTHFEVEVDSMDQIGPVLAAGVDTIMLDNFTLAELAAGVALVAGRARVEASGNVNLATVAGIAATGVDVISIGGLTHSVAALDLGLDIELGPATVELTARLRRRHDLPRRRGHHAGPPRGAGSHVAVPQRGVRQPLEPPLPRRRRRHGARRGPGSDGQGAGLPPGRGDLHLRRHGGGQPRRQGHRAGPAGRGPARWTGW